MRSFLTVIGARPQIIKAAAISRTIAKRSDMAEKIVHTGQHFDQNMSASFLDDLDIPSPAFNLGINGGTHAEMTARMLVALEALMISEGPEGILVYGDTNSTLAGALAAAKLSIPVFHVEAGLRSFNRRMPEEINRILVDHLSSQLFCPTLSAIENLQNEGIKHGVHHVGDVMYDIALHARLDANSRSQILDRLNLQPGGYKVATVHRAENTDDPEALAEIITYLKEAAEECPVVMPLHPRTRAAAERDGLDLSPLVITKPVGYFDMVKLILGARNVLTDSGGLQKEAYFHRVPCITLREETEWVETINAGWNRLWKGKDYEQRSEINEYGDGNAAENIVKILADN